MSPRFHFKEVSKRYIRSIPTQHITAINFFYAAYWCRVEKQFCFLHAKIKNCTVAQQIDFLGRHLLYSTLIPCAFPRLETVRSMWPQHTPGTLSHYTLRRLRHCPFSSTNSRPLYSPEVILTVLSVLNIWTFYYDSRRYFLILYGVLAVTIDFMPP